MKLSWMILPVALTTLIGCTSSGPDARTYELRQTASRPAPWVAPPPAGADLEQKMKALVIPRLEFRDASVEEIVEQLVQWSRELDPSGEGVNIILVPPPPEDTPRKVDPNLTLNLRRVSLHDALRYTADVAGRRVAYTDRAIKLYAHGNDPTQRVITRIYPVHPSFMNVVEPVQPSRRFRNPEAISTLR